MKNILVILFIFSLVYHANAQHVTDLTSQDKSHLFQGIILSKRNKCTEANKLLNNFIANYNGAYSDYWIKKAESYLLPCETKVVENNLEYFYLPKFDFPNNNELAELQGEAFIASDPEFIFDAYAQSFNIIKSLNPEAFYPLLNVEDMDLNDEDNSEFFDEEDDLRIYISKQAAKQYPNNIRIYSLLSQQKETSIDFRIFQARIDKVEKSELRIFRRAELSLKEIESIELYDLNQKSSYKAKHMLSREEKVSDKAVQSDRKISRKTPHYRILFNVSKEKGKTYINLSGIGPITSEEMKSGYNLYYVGFFEQLDEAEKALKKVTKLGYKAAEIQTFKAQKKNTINK